MQRNLRRSKVAQALMDVYNRKGIFSNINDTLEDLEAALRRRFWDVKVESHVTVALFEARAPERSSFTVLPLYLGERCP